MLTTENITAKIKYKLSNITGEEFKKKVKDMLIESENSKKDIETARQKKKKEYNRIMAKIKYIENKDQDKVTEKQNEQLKQLKQELKLWKILNKERELPEDFS